MTLTATKTTTGTLVEGTDSVGKDVELFFNSFETANYDHLVEVEDSFKKQELFESERAKLPDPEKDLYVSIFGKDEEPTDTALHTTLVEAVEARNGISLDWSQNPVTTVLRLIATGNSSRLRLIAGNLVDLGPSAAAGFQAPAPQGNGPFQGSGPTVATPRESTESVMASANPEFLG